MAGPSHSPRSTEMLPWLMRDFPDWTYLNDPCLQGGRVTPLCQGREVELGLEGFDSEEILMEARAQRIPMTGVDKIKSGSFNFTKRLVLP